MLFVSHVATCSPRSIKATQDNLKVVCAELLTLSCDSFYLLKEVLTENYEYLQEFTNSLIPVFHLYATICLYLVYFEYLLVYRYSDLLPTNTNKHLFSHFQLFIIFGQVFDEQT
jgi:hypothetical protein